MAYRDLLVHVDDGRSCAARVQAAVDLAVAHEAHLIGVYVVADPSPAAFVSGYVPPDLIDTLQQHARERADAALARFAEVAARNQISFETRVDRVLYTAVADALSTNARYADLAVLGQADPDEVETPSYLPEEVTLGSGRPILVIPYIGPAPTLGQRVTVAWDAPSRTGGAYSHFQPGELIRFGPWLAAPIGRLHVAGEHTDPWQATMNGALSSGLRAAREILSRLD